MKTIVTRFEEGAYVLTSEGEEIPVFEGMEILEGDIIQGIIITEQVEVDDADEPRKLTDVDELQQAILEGADPTQVGESTSVGDIPPPSAGFGLADTGGSSFVALDRTGGEVDPTAGYATSTFDAANTEQEEGDNALVAPVDNDVPPVEEPVDEPVEPPVDEPEEEPPVEEPKVTVRTEAKEETSTESEVNTVVGDEYEVSRETEKTTTTERSDDGTRDTTTTTYTTTVNYNQVTDTITTNTTTTQTYSREITTTVYPDGREEVVTSEWKLIDTDTGVTQITDREETPRTEIITDDVVSVNLLPIGEGDTYTTDEDTPISGSVGDNDTKGDGEHTYSLIGDDIEGLIFNTNGTFEYTPIDLDGNQEITFDYKIMDVDGDYSTATVSLHIEDLIEPEPEGPIGEWFFSQGGNFVQPGYDYELITESRRDGSMEINVSNKQLGDYRISSDDSVKFTIDITGDAEYNTDYTLDIISKSPQINIDSWGVENNILSVVISTDREETNLSGSTFAIEVTSINEGETVGVEFDINAVVHHDASVPENVTMGTWETNDDVLIGLIDPNYNIELV